MKIQTKTNITKHEQKIVLEIGPADVFLQGAELVEASTSHQFISKRGYLTRFCLYRLPSGQIILCVRERATGAQAKYLLRNDGIGPVNHAVYVYLTDEECQYLNSVYGKEPKEFEMNYEMFITSVYERCWEVPELENDLKLYAVAIYDSDVDAPNNLICFHKLLFPHNSMSAIGDVYKLYAFTNFYNRKAWAKAHPPLKE